MPKQPYFYSQDYLFIINTTVLALDMESADWFDCLLFRPFLLHARSLDGVKHQSDCFHLLFENLCNQCVSYENAISPMFLSVPESEQSTEKVQIE